MTEDEFLHAIASPMSGIELLLDSVVEDLPKNSETEAGVLGALEGIKKLKVLLKARIASQHEENKT